MTVTIDLPKEIEARLLSEAQASGVPFGQLVKEVLIDHFEETEDRLVAESRPGGTDDRFLSSVNQPPFCEG
jgi:hypothetical protein